MKLPYRKVLSLIALAIISYFIGKVIYREWDKISGYNWSPNLLLLIVSILILYLVYIISGYGWILIVRMVGVRIGLKKGLSIFLLSLFGRYIPGGVWAVMGRLYLCRLEGIPDSRSGMSTILEQAYPIVSAGLIFAVSLLFWSDMASVMRVLPVLVFVPIFVIFLHPKPFLKIVNPILSRMGKAPVNISLTFKNMLFLTGYYCFLWLVTGTAFYFFVWSFYPMDVYYIPILSGIYAISFVAGYLAFIAPAGLGVREGSMALLLSLIMPMPIAIGIALLSRLWMMCVELTLLLLLLLNSKMRRMAITALGW